MAYTVWDFCRNIFSTTALVIAGNYAFSKFRPEDIRDAPKTLRILQGSIVVFLFSSSAFVFLTLFFLIEYMEVEGLVGARRAPAWEDVAMMFYLPIKIVTRGAFCWELLEQGREMVQGLFDGTRARGRN
ncbi:hypothetical protein HDV00_007755 [Rhizophlyctis rosea]|nr:hypothetical protein HDV00_007755 [Rhizophlyctis rosea]